MYNFYILFTLTKFYNKTYINYKKLNRLFLKLSWFVNINKNWIKFNIKYRVK